MSELTPVERFFGLAASRGPLELLGLDAGAVDEARVRAALWRRLDALDRHPHARSMEADEARLALHTAAAQLLDPTVRAHIVRHVDRSEPLTPPGVPEEPPIRQTPSAKVARLREFREAAFLLVRGGGGWNRRSLHRVAALAHAYGLSADEVRASFHMPGAPGVPLRRERASDRLHDVNARPTTDAPAARKAPASPIPAVVGGVVGLGVIVVATALLVAPMLQPVRSVDTEPQPSTPPPSAETRDMSASNARLPDEPPPLVTPTNALAILAESVDQATDDPGEAAWRFEQSLEWIASSWPDLTASQRDRALARVSAFLHATTAGGAARRRAVEAIGDGAVRLAADGPPAPGDLAPGAWSVGVMNALSRDRELDAALQLELRGRISAAVGSDAPEDASFRAGALAVLRAVGDDFVGASGESIAQGRATELWTTWGEVVDAIDGGSRTSAARVQTLLLDMVQRVLLEGPSPASDAASRVGVTTALRRLAWGIGDRSTAKRANGGRLLAWFDDPAIPTRDLAVVTEWLATESGADEVTFAMVMPRSASRETRAAYRDRYAEAWGLSSPDDRDSLESAWAQAAAAERKRVGSDVSVAGAIARAVTLSRLNEAAAARWQRDVDRVRTLVASPDEGVRDALSPPSAGGALSDDDGRARWVIEFLDGPANESSRLAALQRLDRRSGPLSRVEGDVLAEVAFWGSPAAVRDRARWLVREHSADPAMVNGLLDALTRAPTTQATAELLEEISGQRLPGADDPDFERAARRALVARLLAMLAGEGELGAIDRLSELLALSHAARAGVASESDRDVRNAEQFGAAPTSERGMTALDSASALRDRWLREASRYAPNPYAPRSLDTTRRRREARLRLAEGAVQAFVAEQATVVDLMAAVVSAERPDQATAAAAALHEYDRARREARHIGQQIEAGEAAMLDLWALRLGEFALHEDRQGGDT